MKIDQRQVIQVALDVLDEQGLAQLQMRAVARRLDVQASALYWHVRNKGQLLSLMAAHFYAMALGAVPAQLGWREWLLEYGRAFRAALLGHRDSAQLCAIARPLQVDPEAAADQLTQPLMAAGLSRSRALSYQASVISLVLGWCIYEQSEALHDYLARMIGFEEQLRHRPAGAGGGFPVAAPLPGGRL